MSSDAYDRFMNSTNLNQEHWREGEPYDLAALDELSQQETNDVIRWVLDKPPNDWRDLQVLAHINSSVTLFKLQKFVDHADHDLRMTAIDLLLDKDPARVPDAEARIVREIESADGSSSTVRLFFLIERFNTPAVQNALLAAMRKGTDFSIHAAAKLMELRGVIESEWDWTHRPLWLQLRHGETPADRAKAFDELCALMKMTPPAQL